MQRILLSCAALIASQGPIAEALGLSRLLGAEADNNEYGQVALDTFNVDSFRDEMIWMAQEWVMGSDHCSDISQSTFPDYIYNCCRGSDYHCECVVGGRNNWQCHQDDSDDEDDE